MLLIKNALSSFRDGLKMLQQKIWASESKYNILYGIFYFKLNFVRIYSTFISSGGLKLTVSRRTTSICNIQYCGSESWMLTYLFIRLLWCQERWKYWILPILILKIFRRQITLLKERIVLFNASIYDKHAPFSVCVR